jgi:hypothetical protein
MEMVERSHYFQILLQNKVCVNLKIFFLDEEDYFGGLIYFFSVLV